MTVTHFTAQQAPCGKVVEADDYEDRDDEALLTQETDYGCGCVSIQHQYHDGSVACKVIHHNGTVLKEELLTAE
ncbi:MAG: hypothetical protein DMF84_08435 [Acidobacteria bacterium]|nr:MAG: hypothetical protein DMF84_08435 [Acidobacteriota bacterium]